VSARHDGRRDAATRPGGVAIHREPFMVRSYDLDTYGRLSFRALCGYLQEAAWRHAAALGASSRRLEQDGLAWVLHRLDVELRRDAGHGDRLELATWPSARDRVVAMRDFELRDDAGVVAAAVSGWSVLDLAARRAVRLPELVTALPLAERARAIERAAREPPGHVEPQVERRFEVRRSDLDTLRHVNNTQYVAWILETVPDELLDSHRPAAVEIRFRSESLLGDIVVSQAQRVGEPALARPGSTRYAHVLRNARDGRERVRATSTWQPSATGP
jgi:acyl-ACP thioesterase